MNIKNSIGPTIHKVEPFYLSDYFNKNNGSILYIGKDEREISSIKKVLNWLLPNVDILLFKAWDQIPYDNVSPSKEVQIERLKTLKKLSKGNSNKIVLTTINSILQKVIPINLINEHSFSLSKNKKINFNDLVSLLQKFGYQRTSLVREKSEFSIRGSILDIFPINKEKPVRLDFFDDEIESIFEFDSINQKRIREIKTIIEFNLSSELFLNDNSLNLFRSNFREIFSNYRNSHIYNLFSQKIVPAGGEQFLPLFYNKLETLFDYLNNYSIFLNDEFENLLDNRLENIEDFYLARKDSIDNFSIEPKLFYLNKEFIYNKIKSEKHYYFNTFDKNNIEDIDVKTIHNLSSIKQEIDFDLINQFFDINSNINKIYICCRSAGSLERVSRIFHNNLNLKLNEVENFHHNETSNILITQLNIEESLKYKDVIYINERSLFGYFFNNQVTKSKKQSIFFEELNKLSTGSVLVHVDYGLCKFNNVKKIELNDSTHECLELEFEDNQKLFLPVENLNVLSKYSDDLEGNITLDKLGSSHWQKRKAEAKKKIKDAAKKLITIASQRLQTNSYSIDIKNSEYDKFASTFPYVETDDQLNAIQDVLNDFSKGTPSDRLIVGDVAFGKTEVILRAIFLAAKSNLQSVVLVPTTILSRQHYNNFNKRLSIFGIKVAEISRLISNKQKKEIF